MQVHRDDLWELSLIRTKELQGWLESMESMALDDRMGGEIQKGE